MLAFFSAGPFDIPECVWSMFLSVFLFFFPQEINPRLSLTRIRRAEHYFESPTVAEWVSTSCHSHIFSERKCTSNSYCVVLSCIFTSLCISSSSSLDRGSYAKGLPQIRIGRDSEDNGFFWKKGSETDLWMTYPKTQQNQHSIANITILFCTSTVTIVPNGIF